MLSCKPSWSYQWYVPSKMRKETFCFPYLYTPDTVYICLHKPLAALKTLLRPKDILHQCAVLRILYLLNNLIRTFLICIQPIYFANLPESIIINTSHLNTKLVKGWNSVWFLFSSIFPTQAWWSSLHLPSKPSQLAPCQHWSHLLLLQTCQFAPGIEFRMLHHWSLVILFDIVIDWWCFIILLWCCLKKGIACWVSNLLVAISVEEQQKVFTSWSSKAIRVFMPASFASAHISLILRVHSSVSSDFSLIVSWRPSSESGSGLSGNMIVENTLSENRPGRRWSFFFVTHGQCLWNDASD